MAYRTIHTKPNGTKYVYEVESYWDKEKHAPRNRQVCLGRLDEATGEIVPSGRAKRKNEPDAAQNITARSKIVGPALLLEKIAADTGVGKDLAKAFPGMHRQILSMAFFLVQKGLPLSRIEMWGKSNMHPCGEELTSQHVSELLKGIGEDGRQKFFALWMKKLSEKECLCYDITSVSSYAEGNEYVRRGYNRDGEKLPQVNLAMLYGQKSGLPAACRRMPGSISDVGTLRTTLAALEFIGQSRLVFVLDRGFYSIANVNALFEKRQGFILSVPTSRKWVQKIIDSYRDRILLPEHYRITSESENLFMLTHLHKWNGRRCYAHIYFNHARAAADQDNFMTQLLAWKEQLEQGKDKNVDTEQRDRFFIIRDTPKKGRIVRFNHEAIEEYRKKYTGFTCILTSKKMDASEALENYRRKEVVENSFDDLKNSLDMKRLRIHSSEAMDARLFIQFIALILLSRFRSIAQSSSVPRLKLMPAREIMEAMEAVVQIRFSGKYGCLTSEIDPLQRSIIEAFGLSLPTLQT